MHKLRLFSCLSSVRLWVLALPLALLATGVCFTAPDTAGAQGRGKPVGHVSMEIGKGGFILSAQGGRGTLSFGGRKYAFRIGGLGVGELGVSKITAYGDVYGLTRVQDFAGAYFQAGAGATAVKGKGVQWLKNANGVELHLRSNTKGFALNLGADGLVVEMGPIKSGKAKK